LQFILFFVVVAGRWDTIFNLEEVKRAVRVCNHGRPQGSERTKRVLNPLENQI